MCLQKIDLLSVNKEHLIHWFVYPNINISVLISQWMWETILWDYLNSIIQLRENQNIQDHAYVH